MKNFILKNNDSSDFNFYDYQGDSNLLIVFFRGAWCNHCKKQLVEINNVLTELTSLKTKVIAVSSDTAFKSSLLKTFLKLPFPVLSDNSFEVINYFNLKTTYKEHEVAKPAVFLISPSHEIIYQYIGADFDDRIDTRTILNNIKQLNEKL